MIEKIQRLKAERGAIVLAHNYCPGEVQDAADFTGDSLELARRAMTVEEGVIVFCGVYFMAETAKILNPDKTVLIPDASAGCPMADMVTAEDVRRLKAENLGAKAVCYVNSTAAVKAECDMCVTSGNAERIMSTFGAGEKIIFVPDRNLGGHIAGKLSRTYELWPGYCPIHESISAGMIAAARQGHPGAVVMVHPECPAAVREAADQILSTGGMCAYVKTSPAEEFIVGTETGILHRLRLENPGKRFHPVSENVVCADMKKLTLEKLYLSLLHLKSEVTVDEEVSVRARRAIEAMLAIV
jgi:quinolinate synthase